MAANKSARIEPFSFAFLVWIFFVALAVLWDVLTGEEMTLGELFRISWMGAIAGVVCYFMHKRRLIREESSRQSRPEDSN